eukprot:13934354-Heterocapsa_arctica.AAC.1
MPVAKEFRSFIIPPGAVAGRRRCRLRCLVQHIVNGVQEGVEALVRGAPGERGLEVIQGGRPHRSRRSEVADAVEGSRG